MWSSGRREVHRVPDGTRKLGWDTFPGFHHGAIITSSRWEESLLVFVVGIGGPPMTEERFIRLPCRGGWESRLTGADAVRCFRVPPGISNCCYLDRQPTIHSG